MTTPILSSPPSSPRLSTGIVGLDHLLQGGLLPAQAYLLRGGPGCGKTTLGFHFLNAGLETDQLGLYITLGEPTNQLQRSAKAIGLDHENLQFLDLSPRIETFTQGQTYDIFSPAEVERDSITSTIMQTVTTLQPKRVVVDSMTQFRYLSSSPFHFRQQTTAFLRDLIGLGATVLFTSEASPEAPDEDLQFISDGIIQLRSTSHYRNIEILKFRGSGFYTGTHTVRLNQHGMQVFPKLQLKQQVSQVQEGIVSSGIPEVDELLCGGLEKGTVSLITGPSGVGKSSLGLQFAKEAAGRGNRTVVYLFEEALTTLVNRCEAINIPVKAMMSQGTLSVVELEPLNFSPDEFGNMVRQEVEEKGSRIVMIDSIAGYRLAFMEENFLRNLHVLCQYLRSHGVTTLLLNEIEAITGDFRATEIGVSYLADNIVFLRFLELRGQLRKAIGVLKKRLSDFERTVREFEITRYGIKVGKPLTKLRGILTGTPEILGSEKDI